MTGRNILEVTRASLPFFFLMLLGIVVITVFPQLVLWPVQLMVGSR